MSDEVRGDSSRGPAEIKNQNKNDNEEVRSVPLQKFKANLVDDSVPEHRDAPASSSH